MELTIALVISILSITFSIIGFALSRKDKSNNDVKDESYHLGQIDTKLKNIEIMLNKIEEKYTAFEAWLCLNGIFAVLITCIPTKLETTP